MSNRRIVHVIGTGTIGEPLIGLLCDYKEQLGIDEVTFNKYTPLTRDRSKVTNLLKRGAILIKLGRAATTNIIFIVLYNCQEIYVSRL